MSEHSRSRNASSVRWAVFVSGEGSNLQNVIDGMRENLWPSQSLCLVHSSRECPAEKRAERAGIPIYRDKAKSVDYEKRLLKALDFHKVERIFLLGYMSILPESFLEQWKGPIINLHPSLLPKYKGLKAAERAYESGDSECGVSLHEVIAELDAGPLIAQEKFERDPSMSFELYQEKIRQAERKIVRDYLNSLEFGRQAPIL